MTSIDTNELNRWIGRAKVAEDVIGLGHAQLLASTLDIDPASIKHGDALRPLWHWSYFLEGQRPPDLGRDGHPARGGFLPPVPLANRMWAGGHVAFHAPVPIGSPVRKVSKIRSINVKNGRSGLLIFVTVEHQLFEDARLLVTELHDIVYKNPSPIKTAPTVSEPIVSDKIEVFHPTSTLLFRYSALTFNGHRIHYDVDYCRDVEGYPGLVVHGPLIATMLAGLASEIVGRPLKTFAYRAIQTAFVGRPVSLKAAISSTELTLWAVSDEQAIHMTATAEF